MAIQTVSLADFETQALKSETRIALIEGEIIKFVVSFTSYGH